MIAKISNVCNFLLMHAIRIRSELIVKNYNKILTEISVKLITWENKHLCVTKMACSLGGKNLQKSTRGEEIS